MVTYRSEGVVVRGALPAHGAAADSTSDIVGAGLPVLAVLAVAVVYAVLGRRERDRRGWPVARTVWFLSGAALIGLALSPRFDHYADHDFGGHMAQHLLLAMVAPLALVLGAPVTLLLRQLPQRHARRLGRLLHRPLVRTLAHPVVGLLLSSGGLILLYFTPLYTLSTRHDGVHALVHAHMLLSGALFAWAVAGPDPAPGRASVRTRLVVLGVAVAIHASVAQLIYAGLFVDVNAPVHELQAAGSLMYFGGDIAELALALALLVTWRTGAPSASRRVAHCSSTVVR
jgi:putative membrane protein